MSHVFSLFFTSPLRVIFTFFAATSAISLFDISGLLLMGEIISSIFSGGSDKSTYNILIFGVSTGFLTVAGFFAVRFILIASCNVLVGRVIFSMSEGYAKKIYGESIRNTAYRELIEQDEKASTIAVDTNTVINTFLMPLAGLVTEVVLIVGIFFVLLYIDFVLALTCFIFGTFLVVLIQNRLGSVSARLGQDRQISEQARIEAIQRAESFRPTIDVYNLTTWLTSLFSKVNNDVTNAGKKQYFVMTLPKYFYELIFVLGLLGALTYIGSDLSGSYLVVILIMRLMPALNRVSTCVASFSSSIAASKRILNIIRPEFSTKIHNTDTSSEELLLQIADFKLDIKWDKDKAEHDHFPRVNPFLWDFSLEIKKGDVVAISGASGVGKSTLLKSIIGQYISPNQVKINGDEVSIFSRAWLDNFAYVPQESKYFSGTVLENILLGRGYDKELIAQVVSSSMLFDVGDISRGLNLETNLGVNGSILSGGQLQRLSIARALYGKPKVLLLDEFTSGLDEATEKTIINTIENISMNISVIAVSHRPVFNVISNKTILFVEGLPTWA